jgi:catechol 2,3-dioxygenase
VTLFTRRGVTRAHRGAFGLFHFAILLPDRAALGRFASHLASLDQRVGMADHLVSEALYLWDPDGLGIEVYADRPRHTWRHQDRELAMTTDPLDIESVIAAGGGEKWIGAPRGTTTGHVHLHVGNLEQAEGFYHRALGLDKTV